MFFPGLVYIVRPWHLGDFCNVFLPNISEDQKKFYYLSAGPWHQGCQSLLSIGGGGGNLKCYPNFGVFLTLGGMNFDQDFIQVSKLSENQKKKSSAKIEHFSPRIQVDTCAQMHTRFKLLGGMQMYTKLKLLGGYIPHHPLGIRHPCLALCHMANTALVIALSS